MKPFKMQHIYAFVTKTIIKVPNKIFTTKILYSALNNNLNQ